MKYARFLSSFLLIIVIFLLVLGIFNKQAIADWLALRSYIPPAEIAKLADDTTMVSDTKRVFYVNHPAVQDKVAFNSNCDVSEQTIVLGCYIENEGIYLFDVTDARLQGVKEVTAAHEVLHAEYDRLSSEERAKVDSMTASYFASQTDARIKSTIESYRTTRGAAVLPTELHSILGTEVENLPADLEHYYAQYFKDRKQIVRFSQQYEQTFVDLRTQVSQYDTQLETLKHTIDTNQAAIETRDRALDNERNRLDSLLQANRTGEYNAAVAGFNQDVNTYNNLVQQTRSLVSQYNAIVERRNAVAVQEQELTHALDSNFSTKSKE